MNYGFVKVAAAVPHVQVADCFYNIQQMEGLMRQASDKGVQIIAFPEMSVTAYTCLDLFAELIDELGLGRMLAFAETAKEIRAICERLQMPVAQEPHEE